MRLENIRNNKFAKAAAFILAMILPVVTVGVFASPADSIFVDIIYYVLWCGFYGSLLCLILFKGIFWRMLITLVNIVIIGLFITGAGMGGWGAMGTVVLQTVLPFVPWISILG